MNSKSPPDHHFVWPLAQGVTQRLTAVDDSTGGWHGSRTDSAQGY